MSSFSRRTMITGLAGSIAAGVTPAVIAGAAEAEGPAERVNRLAQELSEALTDWAGGSFRAIVEPDDPDRSCILFQNVRKPIPMSAMQRAEAWINAAADHAAFLKTGKGRDSPCGEDASHLHDLWLAKERAGDALLQVLMQRGVV